MSTDLEILFEGFSAEQKRAFLDMATPSRRYAVQNVVLKEREWGSEMLLVEDGVLSVWASDVKVGEVRKGSVLGVSTLIEPHLRTATLVAETEARVMWFERSRVLAHFETAPLRLLQVFFVSAFRIHLSLIERCEERIVQLTRELHAI